MAGRLCRQLGAQGVGDAELKPERQLRWGISEYRLDLPTEQHRQLELQRDADHSQDQVVAWSDRAVRLYLVARLGRCDRVPRCDPIGQLQPGTGVWKQRLRYAPELYHVLDLRHTGFLARPEVAVAGLAVEQPAFIPQRAAVQLQCRDAAAGVEHYRQSVRRGLPHIHRRGWRRMGESGRLLRAGIGWLPWHHQPGRGPLP